MSLKDYFGLGKLRSITSLGRNGSISISEEPSSSPEKGSIPHNFDVQCVNFYFNRNFHFITPAVSHSLLFNLRL